MAPSPASRLGGFASGHFVVTSLCAPLLFLAPELFAQFLTPLKALLMMALYIPAGWTVASLRQWERPAPKEGLKAVLYPALFAWGWALGGWLLLTSLPLLSGIGLLMLTSTYFLACPSFTLMLIPLSEMTELADWGSFGFDWYLCMFLAGLLPPLLFFLGTLLPHRVKENLHEKMADYDWGSGSPDMPGDPVDRQPLQPGGNPAIHTQPPDRTG